MSFSIFLSKQECTQRFGVNSNNYPLTQGHEGVDLVPKNRVDWGVHIPAGFKNGIVVLDIEAKHPGRIYGCQVKVLFPANKVILQFCHLSENTVDIGQIVTEGNLIGIMGNTGNSFGAHVHFNTIPTKDSSIKGYPRWAKITEKYKDPEFIMEDPFYWTRH